VIQIIEPWLLVLGIINLVLLVISLLIFIPKHVFRTRIIDHYNQFKYHVLYLLIILGVVALHLIEVNVIDPTVTSWVGTDFASSFQSIENNMVFWFSHHWTSALIIFFVLIYLGIYPFTLWFTPVYSLLTNNTNALKTLAYGLLLIYAVAFPFYLFLPVTNVYTFYGGESALTSVIPTVEQFFYTTTTSNNCFPSLHVAMTLLIARTASLTGNKNYTYFTSSTALLVIIAVIYLTIHWILDVIAGVLLAIGVIYLLKHFKIGEPT
jgi:membrane-associated phospholipid phosphatase